MTKIAAGLKAHNDGGIASGSIIHDHNGIASVLKAHGDSDPEAQLTKICVISAMAKDRSTALQENKLKFVLHVLYE